MIETKRFMSLDEIDFDALYDGSLPKLYENFKWPDGITTPAAQKAFVRGMYNDILNTSNGYGLWAVAPNRIALIGTYEGPVFTFALGLLCPDENGSLAYSMTPEVIQAYRDNLQGAGFTEAHAYLFNESSLIDASKVMWGVGDDAVRPSVYPDQVLMQLM